MSSHDQEFVWLIVDPSHTDSTAIQAPSANTVKRSVFQKLASTFDQLDSEPAPRKFQLGGHELWVKPHIQSFQFESLKGATIEGNDGMLIIVPERAFVNENGYLVTGKVEFRLVEAFGVEQMVLYKLLTISNGSTLESGGMFYLEASINGKPVQVNPERPLYIEIPTVEKKDGMMAFKGVVDAAGTLNWVDPKPLKKYLVKIPLEDLDFLPAGFEAEVKGSMPFLNYETASTAVTDSLYYSLKNIETEDKRSIPKRWNPRGETRQYDRTEIACGIKPTTIEVIRSSEYRQTFVATKEFEERIALLHKLVDGNGLVELYLSNLTKDLYISDSLVSELVDEDSKEIFERLAREKLANVKDAPLYQKRLTDYYTKKRRELNNAHDQLASELATKNRQELEALYAQAMGTTETANGIANFSTPLPSPNAATGNAYSTQWTSMGWGNIDRYYKLLNGGTVETQIAVLNMPNNTSVTQWLGAINTYTDLIGSNNGYRAVFPKSQSRSSQTHVFAIAASDSGYSWGLKHYDPYKESDVQFEMATASITDIKTDLRAVDARFGPLQKRLAWKEEQAKQAVIMQMQTRQKQEAWRKERKKLFEDYKDALRRQREIDLALNKLRKVAFPCDQADEW